MRAWLRSGMMALALAAAGCAEIGATGTPSSLEPKPEEMRQALLKLMNDRPDISIPEFKESLELDRPVTKDGIVYIGVWNCDPKLMTFEALFSAPNITMYEASGRFVRDARDIWRAVPRRVMLTQKRDVTEFWRAHEVEAR